MNSADLDLRLALSQLLESYSQGGVQQMPGIAAPPPGPAMNTSASLSSASRPVDRPAARPTANQEEPMPRPRARGSLDAPQPGAAASVTVPENTAASAKPAASPRSRPAAARSPAAAGDVPQTWDPNLPLLSLPERGRAFEQMRGMIAACTLCPALVANRTQTVFGVGDLQPELVFFGEAPGADEDRQGEPFVGAAGRLLNDIITKGMQMRREEVYILNVLKCRPPQNRPPEQDEIANCRPYFEQQLEVLRPKYIVCLGLYAAKSLLQTNASVGKLRGRLHRYKGAEVLVTYHPAYLLRNPPAKKDVWEDIKLLLTAMGRAV